MISKLSRGDFFIALDLCTFVGKIKIINLIYYDDIRDYHIKE